jgi:predicted transcriptional regulator
MTTYRSQVRVMADLLRAIRDDEPEGGAKVSVLLRKANMSYARMVELTDQLVEKGLLIKVPAERGNLYKLSERGKEFLANVETFEKFAEAYGLKI